MGKTKEMPIEVDYEIYTASGTRVVVSGTDIVANYEAGDLTIFDASGKQVAQFQLMNIEGWRERHD